MAISRFVGFNFHFLIGSTAGAFFMSIAMYKSLLAKLKLQS